MTPAKTIPLTTQTFVSKAMPLLFNTLSRFVIVFLPRSKHLLISWLNLLSTMILEPKKIKSVTASTFFPIIYHEVMGLDATILVVCFSFLFVCFSLIFILKEKGWRHETEWSASSIGRFSNFEPTEICLQIPLSPALIQLPKTPAERHSLSRQRNRLS